LPFRCNSSAVNRAKDQPDRHIPIERRRNRQAETNESFLLRQCVPVMGGTPLIPVAALQHKDVGGQRRFSQVSEQEMSGYGDVSLSPPAAILRGT